MQEDNPPKYGGDGWLRLLEFDLEQKKVHVSTFSTEFNKYELDENSDFYFDIDWEERSMVIMN